MCTCGSEGAEASKLDVASLSAPEFDASPPDTTLSHQLHVENVAPEKAWPLAHSKIAYISHCLRMTGQPKLINSDILLMLRP